MKTLIQHLNEQPFILVETIARLQGLEIVAEGRKDFTQALAAQAQNRAHWAEVWRDLSAAAQAALHTLAASDNLIPSAAFLRRFGDIRPFGPGALQWEKPWAQPAGPAEELWYRGLIVRGFADTPIGLAECIAIPTDVLPLLPLAGDEPRPLPIAAVAAPLSMRDDGDRALDDLATLLIYVQNHRLWLNSKREWRRPDLHDMFRQWLVPPADPASPLAPADRPALVFHCARALGLITVKNRRQQLHARAVRDWLGQERRQQSGQVFAAWRDAAGWNDLCRTPGLKCQPGNWRNDPVLTRHNLLDILRHLSPGDWHTLPALIAAVQSAHPDFQRPDGNYDTWYVSDEAGAYLRGFEHWPEVEGRVLRYVWMGPLLWLGLIAADNTHEHWRLTERGATWLQGSIVPGPDPAAPPLVVTEDFRVLVPTGARLLDRFRLARFCDWEASWPGYRYRITQRGLRRAAADHISAQHILDFLAAATGDQIPTNVRGALARYQPTPS